MSEVNKKLKTSSPEGSIAIGAGANPAQLPTSRGRVRSSNGDSGEKKSGDSKQSGEALSVVESIASGDRKDGRAHWIAENSKVFSTIPEGVTNKHGIDGNMQLFANYFTLIKGKEFLFVQYKVQITPEVDDLKVRRRLIASIRNNLRAYVFDGVDLVYLTRRLPQDLTTFVAENDGTQYNLIFRFTSVIDARSNNAIMVMNTILRRAMEGLKLQLIQRNLFDPQARVALNDYHLDLWPGYVTSIREHDAGLLVCCEITHKVLHQDNVLEFANRTSQDPRNRNEDRRSALQRCVTGTVVLTTYNNRTYRIDDIDFSKNPRSTFEMKDGRTMSFAQYYQERYNITIRDLGQPLLVSNPKSRDIRAGRTQVALLVPELCRPTGLSDAMRSDFRLMLAMGDHTRQPPNTKQKALYEFGRRISQERTAAAQFDLFGLQFQPDLLQVKGRQIEAEKILFGNNAQFPTDNNADFTKGFFNNPMFMNERLENWYVVFPKRSEESVNAFFTEFRIVAKSQGFTVNRPVMCPLDMDRANNYSQEIDQIVRKDPKFIFFFLPNNQADRYQAVKKITCIKSSVPTQGIVMRTIQPKKGGLKTIATKIVIQVNAKLGGAPWMIKMPLAGLMTVGYDVSPDSTNKSKSWGAFVATMDLREKVKFYSAVSQHNSSTECSEHIKMQFYKALAIFRNEHNALPKKILFYRDGVGEGQIAYVREYELNFLKQQISEVYQGIEKPQLEFIIVSKRINTRFMLRTGRENYQNPPPGTVVDNYVTLPNRYDFYLISQSVRQGTVSPTYYNIINHEFKFKDMDNPQVLDKIQQLTYKFCHLYYNWSGTTRVPVTVQLAHKLSVLVSQHLREAPHEQLSKRLYFL